MSDTRDHPPLRCLTLPEWPERHRQAWEVAFADSDLLGEAGPAARWSASSCRKTRNGFGLWLSWCASGGIDPDVALADLVTPERVRAYLLDLVAFGRASLTVTCHAQELYDAVRVMAPDVDWSWLMKVHKAQRARSHPERDKLGRLRPAADIEAVGLRLMAEAEAATHWSDQRRAVHFRDGLMIVFLIRRLLRLKNFAALRLGEHLLQEGNTWILHVERREMKGKRPFQALLPPHLQHALGRYLDHHRPVLLRGEDGQERDHDALWVSEVGTPMAERSIHGRICKHTRKAFGRAIPPHFFRDAGATAYAEHAPQKAREIKHLLAHATLDIAEQHYIHAQAINASWRHVAMMEELRLRALDDEEEA
jgi:integrase/recombinase XerD